MVEKKSRPASDRAASEIVLADSITDNKSSLILQPLDDLARLRTLYLIKHFSLASEVAAAVALLASGGVG